MCSLLLRRRTLLTTSCIADFLSMEKASDKVRFFCLHLEACCSIFFSGQETLDVRIKFVHRLLLSSPKFLLIGSCLYRFLDVFLTPDDERFIYFAVLNCDEI